MVHFLPPATKLGQGYIFTGVCDSVHRGGWYPSMHCRRYPSMPCSRGCAIPACLAAVGGSAPVGVATWDPPDGHCCGRYAFYWNAFLLAIKPSYLDWFIRITVNILKLEINVPVMLLSCDILPGYTTTSCDVQCLRCGAAPIQRSLPY